MAHSIYELTDYSLDSDFYQMFNVPSFMLRSLQRCTASIACSRHTTITSTTTRPRTRPMATVPSGEDRLSPHIERKRGTIEIICGPMFSGKTTELLRRLRRQQLAGRRVILIKHAIDNRYGARLTYIDEQGNIQDDAGASTSNPNVSMNNQTSSSSSSPSQSSSSSSSTSGGKRLPVSEAVTHDNIRFRAVPAQTISSVASLPEVRDADVIGVDEGQFFEDLAVAADKLANTGKRVVVAALDGTFRQEPFPSTVALISRAEHICKLTAVCRSCGNDAAFTVRTSTEMDVTVVGGSDKYMALCRECILDRYHTHTHSSNLEPNR